MDRDVTQMPEQGEKAAREENQREARSDKPNESRRALLKGLGRAAWAAPTLAVLGTLAPGSANAGSTVTGCPPFPDPNTPGCG